MSKEIIYVADPMCSWCWGFSPAIEALRGRFSARMPVRLLVGGLMPNLNNRLTDESKSEIRHHWEQVHEATGQPFCFDFFEHENFTYNTEPSCRAVVVARNIAPELSFPFLANIHEAFYVGNRDVTDPKILLAVAEETGIDPQNFATIFNAKETMEETFRDFQTSRQMNVGGFPSVLLRDDEDYAFLTVGYQPLENLEPIIDIWSKDQRPAREQFKTG
jgi:putative protein-disulfide isomerase